MSVLYTDNRIHDTKCLHEMAGMKYVNNIIDHNATNFCVKAVVYSISKFNVDDSPMEGFTKAAVMKIGTFWNKKKDPPPSSSSSKNKSSAPNNVNNPKAKPNHPNSNPHINADDDDDQYEQFYGQNDDAGGGPSNYYPNQKNNRDNNDPYNNNLTYSGEIPLSSLSSIVGDDHNNNVVPNVTSPRDDNKPAANRSGIIVRRKNGPNDLGIGGAEVDGGIPLRSSADIPIINNNNNNNNNNAVIPNVNFNRLNENEKCAMPPSSTYIQQQQQLQLQQQLPQQNNYISSYNVVQPPNYKNMPPNADNQYANQNQYYQAAPPQNDYSNAFPSVPTNPPPAIPTRQHNQQNPHHSHHHQNQDLAEIKQYPGTLRLLLIPNLGNTCYFNTAIQILRSIIAPVDGNSLNVGNGNGNSELEMIVRDLMLIYGRQNNYAYIERVAQYLRDHTHHKILRHEQADCSEIFFSMITELKTNAVSLLSQIEFELGGIGMQCSTCGAQNFDERVMGKYYTITADHVSTIDEVFNSFFFPTKIIDTCQGCGAREVRVKGMKFLKKKSKYFVVVIPSPTTANIQITPFVNIPHMNLKLSLSCFSIHNGTLQNGHYRFVTLTSRNLICISDDHYSNYELHFLNNRSYGNNFPDKPTILVYRIA